MKPAEWNTMTDEAKVEMTQELMKSIRGVFVIGQALYISSQVLKRQPHPLNELSNAEDMEMMGEAVFGMGFQTAKATHERAIDLMNEGKIDVSEVPYWQEWEEKKEEA
tara:strand:- start:109 stop:432 length:324 start_codon:yes stop_codon:yes gene_type:complete